MIQVRNILPFKLFLVNLTKATGLLIITQNCLIKKIRFRPKNTLIDSLSISEKPAKVMFYFYFDY